MNQESNQLSDDSVSRLKKENEELKGKYLKKRQTLREMELDYKQFKESSTEIECILEKENEKNEGLITELKEEIKALKAENEKLQAHLLEDSRNEILDDIEHFLMKFRDENMELKESIKRMEQEKCEIIEQLQTKLNYSETQIRQNSEEMSQLQEKLIASANNENENQKLKDQLEKQTLELNVATELLESLEYENRTLRETQENQGNSETAPKILQEELYSESETHKQNKDDASDIMELRVMKELVEALEAENKELREKLEASEKEEKLPENLPEKKSDTGAVKHEDNQEMEESMLKIKVLNEMVEMLEEENKTLREQIENNSTTLPNEVKKEVVELKESKEESNSSEGSSDEDAFAETLKENNDLKEKIKILKWKKNKLREEVKFYKKEMEDMRENYESNGAQLHHGFSLENEIMNSFGNHEEGFENDTLNTFKFRQSIREGLFDRVNPSSSHQGELEQELNVAKTQITSLQGKIQELENEKASTVAQYKEKIKELESKAEEISESQEEKYEPASNVLLQQENMSLKLEIETLQKQGKLATEKEVQEAASREIKIRELDLQLESRVKEILDLQEKLGESVRDRQKEKDRFERNFLEESEKHKKTLESLGEEFKLNLDSVSREKDHHHGETEKLKKNEELLKSEVSSLTIELDSLKKEIEPLNSLIQSQKNEIDSLKGELIPLNKKIKLQEMEIEALEKKILDEKNGTEEKISDFKEVIANYEFQFKERDSEYEEKIKESEERIRELAHLIESKEKTEKSPEIDLTNYVSLSEFESKLNERQAAFDDIVSRHEELTVQKLELDERIFELESRISQLNDLLKEKEDASEEKGNLNEIALIQQQYELKILDFEREAEFQKNEFLKREEELKNTVTALKEQLTDLNNKELDSNEIDSSQFEHMLMKKDAEIEDMKEEIRSLKEKLEDNLDRKPDEQETVVLKNELENLKAKLLEVEITFYEESIKKEEENENAKQKIVNDFALKEAAFEATLLRLKALEQNRDSHENKLAETKTETNELRKANEQLTRKVEELVNERGNFEQKIDDLESELANSTDPAEIEKLMSKIEELTVEKELLQEERIKYDKTFDDKLREISQKLTEELKEKNKELIRLAGENKKLKQEQLKKKEISMTDSGNNGVKPVSKPTPTSKKLLEKDKELPMQLKVLPSSQPLSTPEKKVPPYSRDLKLMSPRNEDDMELHTIREKNIKEAKISTYLLIKTVKNYFPGYLQLNEKNSLTIARSNKISLDLATSTKNIIDGKKYYFDQIMLTPEVFDEGIQKLIQSANPYKRCFIFYGAKKTNKKFYQMTFFLHMIEYMMNTLSEDLNFSISFSYDQLQTSNNYSPIQPFSLNFEFNEENFNSKKNELESAVTRIKNLFLAKVSRKDENSNKVRIFKVSFIKHSPAEDSTALNSSEHITNQEFSCLIITTNKLKTVFTSKESKQDHLKDVLRLQTSKKKPKNSNDLDSRLLDNFDEFEKNLFILIPSHPTSYRICWDTLSINSLFNKRDINFDSKRNIVTPMSDKYQVFSPDREMEKKASINISLREKEKREGFLVLKEQLARRTKDNELLRKKIVELENDFMSVSKSNETLSHKCDSLGKKMRVLLLNLTKIQNDSIHKKSKRNPLRVPTSRKLERQSDYVRRMIDETEYINFTKLSESIFKKKSKHLAEGEQDEDERGLEISPGVITNSNERGKGEIEQDNENEEEEEVM